MLYKLLPVLTIFLVFVATTFAKDYQLYYLGGQSNMDGYGLVSELNDGIQDTLQDAMIFHGSPTADGTPALGLGIWAPLRPGHGADFRSDGKANNYGQRFGCELSFAAELKRLRPNENIAIIKYSRGGTSIATEAARHFGCWDPDFEGGEGIGRGMNQYDHFLATVRNALSVGDIDADGENDRLIPAGILWMQGESDAGFQVPSTNYGVNLKRLMDLARAALRADDLPIAVGLISDSNHNGKIVWEFGESVRKHQLLFCQDDPKAELVTSTDKYGYSDPWHYDTLGYLDLGKEFARALHDLRRTQNHD